MEIFQCILILFTFVQNQNQSTTQIAYKAQGIIDTQREPQQEIHK